ncbi:protein FraH-like [Battus philenor]|uniref:protein FraH-like n=1 Tax=Battus philenor TaxID=42288 RepID=UPI0035CEB0C8
MKSLFVAAAVLALAVASPVKRAMVQPGPAGPAPVIDLDQLHPIAIGPAIVDNYEPIAVGPTFVDNYEPIAIGPAIVDPAPVAPSPAAPLVQLIVNVNANFDGSPVAVESPEPVPMPVQVVEAPEPAPAPVQVVEESTVPEPVIVVEQAPAPESVNVAEPIGVIPIVIPPDTLN